MSKPTADDVAHLRTLLEEDKNHAVKILKTAKSATLIDRLQRQVVSDDFWLARLNEAHPKG